MSEIDEREEVERSIRERRAAIKIQSVFRGYQLRKEYATLGMRNQAAKVIQRVWRKHIVRHKIHKVKRTLALFRITRVVHSYRLRMHLNKEHNRLMEVEQVLMFYPGKSNPPEPKKRGKVKFKKVEGIFAQVGRPGLRRPMMAPKGASRPKGDNAPIEAQVETSRARALDTPLFPPDAKRGAKTQQVQGQPQEGARRGKRILVELPPPWHHTDVKRLSAAQQDEMMFNQKNDLGWVKKELIPLLWKGCVSMFGEREELLKKNKKFLERKVNKSFISPVPRTMKALGMKTPKQALFVGDGCLLVVASSSSVVVVEPKSISADEIVSDDMYDILSPMFDVAIHPFSGAVVAIDLNWVLRLYLKGKSVLELPLEVENKIPKIQKYLHFDKNGMVWVNLWPQGGHLLLVDPLTFQVALRINIEGVLTNHRNMRSLLQLIPISHKDQPYGFAGIFSGTTDVTLYSYDFTKWKVLQHPDMQRVPCLKQVEGKIYIWSADKVVYAYELGEYLDATKMIGRLKLSAPPTDICGTHDPNMLYIACEDGTVHAFLGKSTEYQMRMSETKVSPNEAAYANTLLGPMTYTQSRQRYSEMASYKFTSVPLKIAAFPFSEKLTMVCAIYQNSNMGTIWMVNDFQSVKVSEFDKFEYSDPQKTNQVAAEDFNANNKEVQKRRQRQLDLMKFNAEFDDTANSAFMNNRWHPETEEISLVSLYTKTTLREWYPFLPDEVPDNLTAYEAFHYLKRTGALPNNASTFATFLQAFGPEKILRELPPGERVVNPMIPARTSGFYNAIVNCPFPLSRISEIVDMSDPLAKLRECLHTFQLSETFWPQDEDISVKRKWTHLMKREGLTKRLSMLSTLEDIVKLEMMARIQKDIDAEFEAHQVTKAPTIHALDLSKKPPVHGSSHVNYVGRPNRNPLLDEKGHKTIYDSWSTSTMYGRDQVMQVNLRCLRIPNSLFAHSQVSAHLELVRKVAPAMKRVSSTIHSFAEFSDDITQIVITEDSRALPLSHYLLIHSFLGQTSCHIQAVKSIMSRIMSTLAQLHKTGIIVRTVTPTNILMNASDNSITFGNIYDCQEVAKESKSVYLPFSEEFGDPSNPFLPPEYFHEPPRRWTQAFDVWQIGMVLLYMITGFLPKSYGSELMSHLGEGARMPKDRHVTMFNEKSPLDDPPVYPRVIFFYDWLNGSPLVGPNERCTGERGECFFQSSESGNPATILDLDKYKLLPYSSSRQTFDERKCFVEIISSCLQVDPQKRPTVEQLLRTYMFSQPGQSNDILDQYIRTPDTNVFISQFFTPVLNRVSDETFPFAMGIISAVMFADEITEEDQPYAFPLDSRANAKVLSTLFEMKFLDKILVYIVNRVSERITQSDVNPVITYKDEMFDLVHRFFSRFVNSVDKGTGPLQGYTHDVIMGLYSLYAGNPYLRHKSTTLVSSPQEMAAMGNWDSAAACIFFHSKFQNLVKYTFDGSMYIRNSIKRTAEHNNQYFEQFLSFAEAVKALCHALCFSLDKQRANAIKTMSTLWQNGISMVTVRLFVDFRVPQKIINCYFVESSKHDSASFICAAYRAIKLKAHDPTIRLLQASVNVAPVFLHCASGIRMVPGTSDSMKLPTIEIARNVLFGGLWSSLEALFVGDTIWSLVDVSKESVYRNLLADGLNYALPFYAPIIFYSQHLQKALKTADIDYLPRIDYSEITSESTLEEMFPFTKKLAASLIFKSHCAADFKDEPSPLNAAIDYFKRFVNLSLKECDNLAKKLEAKSMSPTKTSTPAKLKEPTVSPHQLIIEACELMTSLFKGIIAFWNASQASVSHTNDIFEFVKQLLVAEIPIARNIPHPAWRVYRAVEWMFVYCARTITLESPLHRKLGDLLKLWVTVMKRDIDYTVSCTERDAGYVYIMSRYPEERVIRMEMLKALVKGQMYKSLSPIYEFIVREMLKNTTEITFDVTAGLVTDLFMPIRTEAVQMILYLLGCANRYDASAREMASELLESEFLESEGKLTQSNDNLAIIKGTISLLRATVFSVTLFDDETIKRASVMLSSLNQRFSRKMMDLEALKSRIAAMPKPKLAPLAPLARESWHRASNKTHRKGRDVYKTARVVAKPVRSLSNLATRKKASPR